MPMEKGYHKGLELTMQGLGLSLEELAGQPLELFAREGARLILTVAVEEEVTEFLKRGPYERSKDFRGYRNGRRARRLSCGAGEIELAMPRVSDTSQPFRSQLLGAWQRRSKLLEDIIPLLYVEGLSTETLSEHSNLYGVRVGFPVPVSPGQIKLLRKPSTTGATATSLGKRYSISFWMASTLG